MKKPRRGLLTLAVVAGGQVELGAITGAQANRSCQAGMAHQGSERLHDLRVI
jgi:hypothetical protein